MTQVWTWSWSHCAGYISHRISRWVHGSVNVHDLLQALDLADEAGVDVVMVSPDASPPVVRLIEVSKLKYEQEKAKKEASRKSRAAR